MSTAASLLPLDTVDTCIVGPDPGGIALALTLAAAGAPVAVVLPPNAGLTLPALALRLSALRHATGQGGTPEWPAVRRAVLAAARRQALEEAPHRLAAAGIRVIVGEASFTGPRSLAAGGCVIQARRFVLATGATPHLPAVPGLDTVSVLTADTIWDLDEAPTHLAVMGGDGTAAALAQGFRRLGANVTVFAPDGLLPGSDPDMVAALRDHLRAEGIALFEGASVTGLEAAGDGIAVRASRGDEQGDIVVSHLLVSAGRTPAIARLGLDAAGIAHAPAGVTVDGSLLTTNRRVFALGETADRGADASLSARQAALVAGAILLRKALRSSEILSMRSVHTRPAIVEMGLGEAEARRRDPRCRVLRLPAGESPAVWAAGEPEGFVKLIVAAGGRILGAAVCARQAEAVAAPIALALGTGLTVHNLAAIQLPYPAVSDLGKRAALAYVGDMLSNPSTRRTMRLLRWLG